MNALLQLMALPATCMLIAWARHGGASALVQAVYHIVAMAAGRDIARVSLPACVAIKPASKPGKAPRTSTIAVALRLGMTKDGRIPRNPVPVRASVAGDGTRSRRVRPPWAMGTTTR